ncbi:gastrula zinc finger protein XlCGF7.1-like [Polypterus senegalus]|uniref:gastrula zinc finger protein XlCGF7.1-like n=1 Tax=Polypterus senegalus TaxID=55291 RepID=UPI001964CC55|nr:gastrula zinc finger protein XlCGF7.1-like [Polypterus senegalus]
MASQSNVITNKITVTVKLRCREKPYFCSECGKRLSDRNNFQKHIRVHTGEKPYHCSECDKQFSRSDSHQTHTIIHTGENPYCSLECGKRFSDNSSLWIPQKFTPETSHITALNVVNASLTVATFKPTRVHTGEKPHYCCECGKRFSHSSTLQKHASVHTGEKPFCYSECGRRFSEMSSLQAQKRIHTGVKPYCC